MKDWQWVLNIMHMFFIGVISWRLWPRQCKSKHFDAERGQWTDCMFLKRHVGHHSDRRIQW